MNVMITGASGGLGRALAVECARRGYRLFLTDIRQAGLLALKEGLQRQFEGVEVCVFPCDLTRDDSVDGLLGFIDKCGFKFDMLLNVAGVDFEGSFIDRERSRVLDIVSLNISATLRVTHGILARRRRGGRFFLVFVSSLASQYPIPLKATYAASKRFLLDFAIALKQELKAQNATVLALCPGGLATTEETLQGIAAQGIWGDFTTNKLEVVARQTIGRALLGQAVYVPGVVNRTLSVCGKLLPRSVVAALLYKRWSAAQSKWLDVEHEKAPLAAIS